MMSAMATTPIPETMRDRYIGRLGRTARFNPLATAGVIFIAIFVCFSLFSPLVATHDPAAIDLPARLSSPSTQHWFGTDELGRDIFSRIVYGSRISMLVG